MDLNNTLCAYRRLLNFQLPMIESTLHKKLILKGAPAAALWGIFQDDLAADFASNLAQSAALKSIDLMLDKHGRSTVIFRLPKVHDNRDRSFAWSFRPTTNATFGESTHPQLKQVTKNRS